MKNASLIQYEVYNLFINSADLNNNQLLFIKFQRSKGHLHVTKHKQDILHMPQN